MQPLRFDHDGYRDGDGRRVVLISGEIHYFRLPRDAWADRLAKLRDAGANAVATYVPWLLHEPEEGRFDFDGPLDVGAFLDECARAGLWVLARPGPYQYSELVYDGLPGWLCENYPAIRARNLAGDPFRVSSVSYLHPEFLARQRRWYDAVVPRLAARQTSRGGPVAAVQIDNELMGIHEWHGGWDYHPDTMGVGRETGRWPDLLRRLHGTLDAANRAYGASAASWAELRPVAAVRPGHVGDRRLVADYDACYFESIAEYAAGLADDLRARGVDAPIIHNSANPNMNAYFKETVARLGTTDFLLGSDHYYCLGPDWRQNNPTPQYAAACLVSNEVLRAYGYPPTVYEMPGGSLSDWPPVTAPDAETAYLLNLAFGAQGWNYYIFAGGPNPAGAGTTGAVYDYGAAVGADGTVRPLYDAQRRTARFVRDHAWLAGAARVADCRILLDWDAARAQRHGVPGPDLGCAPSEAWTFAREGMLTTALCAGASPEFADPENEATWRDAATPLLVPAADAMAEATQRRLAAFLDAGGRFLLAPTVPTLDERYRPCRILADRLGVDTTPLPRAPAGLTAWGVPDVFMNGRLFALMRRPDDAEVAADDARSGRDVGCVVKSESGGAAAVLGLRWSQSKREHEEMLRRALAALGHRPALRCDNPNVWATLRVGEGRAMLFLLNLFTSPMEAATAFRAPTGDAWIETGRLALPPMSVTAWRDGRVAAI